MGVRGEIITIVPIIIRFLLTMIITRLLPDHSSWRDRRENHPIR
jgi:hypothetical protein